MKKIMNMLLLSCLKATELMEKRLHFQLSRKERIQLKAHKMMCEACVRYEKQSTLLEKGIEKIHKDEFTETDLEELKQQIVMKLEGSK